MHESKIGHIIKGINRHKLPNEYAVFKYFYNTPENAQIGQYFLEEIMINFKVKDIDSEHDFVKFLGYCEEKPNTLIFGMEEGECSLNEILNIRKKKGLFYTESEIAYLLQKWSNAFSLLESHHIAHCDIKPGNIVLTKNYENSKLKIFFFFFLLYQLFQKTFFNFKK